MSKAGYVYILSSKGRKHYPGVTLELRIRVKQYQRKLNPDSNTAR